MGDNLRWLPSGPSPLQDADLPPRLIEKYRRWGKGRAKGEMRGEGHMSAGRVKRERQRSRQAVAMLGFGAE